MLRTGRYPIARMVIRRTALPTTRWKNSGSMFKKAAIRQLFLIVFLAHLDVGMRMFRNHYMKITFAEYMKQEK